MNINIGTEIELNRLIETRLIIQANSGAGKSWAIRKLLEESSGKVQQILLDLEGEFFSLREKYDFVVFGSEGDYPVHIKYADKVARTLLELNVSAIIDLYELKHHERILFVKRFLDSMINAPKELWHPCLVIIDEAHIFAPEKGNAESQSSVIDLCTRGRKRGYCAVLATQRLSKLHKDAAAECNNKLIGRTGLDIDMKRAGDELGFNTRADVLSLRELRAGEFFAFGPAISNSVTRIKVGMVKTSHPKSGSRMMAIPSPSAKIKKILSEFKDLPQEAEKELQTVNDYKAEIRSLKTQLTQTKKQQPVQKVDMTKFTDSLNELRNENKRLNSIAKELSSTVKIQQGKFDKIKEIVGAVKNIRIDVDSKKTFKLKDVPILPETVAHVIQREERERIEGYKRENVIDNEIKLKDGAKRMLSAIIKWNPNGITAQQVKVQATIGHKNTFSTYKTQLISSGLVYMKGDLFYPTQEGIDYLGGDISSPETTEEVLQSWLPLFKDGARRMLKYLVEKQGEYITHDELMQMASIEHKNTYSTYKTQLKSAHLVIDNGSMIAANKDTLFL